MNALGGTQRTLLVAEGVEFRARGESEPRVPVAFFWEPTEREKAEFLR
jgi:hypothetical protein